MVHLTTTWGDRVFVTDRVARQSQLFASMLDDNGDEDIPVPWSPDQVKQVVHIMTVLTDEPDLSAGRFFPDAGSTRELLTQISTVLPLLDFVAVQPAIDVLHAFIHQTFDSCKTPDDVIRICFEPTVYARLPPPQQRAVYETCLTHLRF